jgi:hypothetical protein
MQRRLIIVGVLAAAAASSGQALQPAPVSTVSQDIDDIVEHGCKSAGVKALSRCNDAEFLRRVWLDLAGRTPPVQAVEKLSTAKPLDRSEVVRTLLESKDYATYWGTI